jgi:hypothetical protein
MAVAGRASTGFDPLCRVPSGSSAESVGVLVSQLQGRVYCYASTGSPEPRQTQVELVKIYDFEAYMSSLAALDVERGEAQARPGLSSKAAD